MAKGTAIKTKTQRLDLKRKRYNDKDAATKVTDVTQEVVKDAEIADSSSDESVYSGLEDEPDTSDVESDNEDDDEKVDHDNNVKENPQISNEEEEEDGNEEDDDSKDLEDQSMMDEDDGAMKDDSVNTDEMPLPHGVSVPDEYEYDSSDEEDIRNTVGNIPMEWYREYKHIGYDTMGRKLIKPQQGDLIDNFLKKMDDPDYWRTVTNKLTGQEVRLTDEDLRIVENIRSGRTPAHSEDPYAPWIEFFTNEVMIHPLSNRPADKRSFVPSKWERLKVGQMVHALKMGWMKPHQPKVVEKEYEKQFFMLWKDDDKSEVSKRYRQTIPAPKLPLPGHAESYNPPPEYLFNEKEKKAWLDKDPDERRQKFMPEKFDVLRHVPAFKDFVKERFERCLDLYLCPRQRRMKLQVDPEDLIPKLPKPRDLQPFPTVQSILYKGHTGMVRCISLDPTGQWLASGSDDSSVRFWEVATGRCVKIVKTLGKVTSVAWNPNPDINLVAFTADRRVCLLNPGLVDKLLVSTTDDTLSAYVPPDEPPLASSKVPVTWEESTPEDQALGFRLSLSLPMEMKQVSWHGKGDYFVTVMPRGDSRSVLIHQLSRRRSQNPFKKPKGLIQSVLFHPVKPFLFIASQRYVRVYNLLKQQLLKKYQSNCKWVSSMSIHPGGDNFIIGSYDCRLGWFDMDLSPRPYQNLRHHTQAVRQVAFHKRYPLFASVSDDGTAIVFHGMVYNDLLKNALIVPVKVLRGHRKHHQLTALDCTFHPYQPWLFTSGADATIRLYT